MNLEDAIYIQQMEDYTTMFVMLLVFLLFLTVIKWKK